MRLPLLIMLAFVAGCGDEVDDRPARWSYISRAILQPNCATASCHSGLARTAGLRFDTAAQGYASLLDEGLVAPGDPASSELVDLLGGRGLVAVRRDDAEREDEAAMPPGNPLPDSDILLIIRWIEAGAEED